jgi:hypothetical protein
MKIGFHARRLFEHSQQILILLAFLFAMTSATFADTRHPAEQAEIKSVNGNVGTSLAFINRGCQTIKVYWLDYEGNRVLYKTLKSQEGYSVNTYLTHPWLITNESDKAWYVYYADAQPRTIEIIPPAKP